METAEKNTDAVVHERKLTPSSLGLESVPRINIFPDLTGEEAEIIDFKITRAELRALAYHYLERQFTVEEWMAVGNYGSWECNESLFTWVRFKSIATTLQNGPVCEFQDYVAKRRKEVKELHAQYEAYMEAESGREAEKDKRFEERLEAEELDETQDAKLEAELEAQELKAMCQAAM